MAVKMIFKGDDGNTPFSSERAALAALGSKGLDKTNYTVIEVQGGFALMEGSASIPAASREEEFDIYSEEALVDGWVIYGFEYNQKNEKFLNRDKVLGEYKTQEEAVEALKPNQNIEGIPKKDEPYYWVRFHDKRDPKELDHVELSWQGESIQIKRGERVPVARRFLESADHTTYPQFRQLPGQARKQVATIKTFPYDFIAKATYADFLQYKTEGTEITRKWVEEHGNELGGQM